MSPVSRKRKKPGQMRRGGQVGAVSGRPRPVGTYRVEVGKLIADILTDGRSIADPEDRLMTLTVLQMAASRAMPQLRSASLDEVLEYFRHLHAAGGIEIVGDEAFIVFDGPPRTLAPFSAFDIRDE